LTPFRIPGERECWNRPPSKTRRIRRASVSLVVGSGGQTRAMPASTRWGEKPSEV
jgi:hypothetical protein